MDYGNTATFRTLLNPTPGQYIGIDISPGQGVDRVVDLTADFARIRRKLPETFNTVFCLSVLEHCPDPFLMARHIEALLNPGGHLYVSVPFAWRIHEYPKDYWRFTPDGIRTLFAEVDFLPEACAYHSTAVGKFHPAGELPPRIDPTFGALKPRFGALAAFSVGVLRTLGIGREIFRHHYLFPPVQLNMIGRKQKE